MRPLLVFEGTVVRTEQNEYKGREKDSGAEGEEIGRNGGQSWGDKEIGGALEIINRTFKCEIVSIS